MASTSADKVTKGVRVMVRSRYVEAQSSPAVQRYVFAYTVTIGNETERQVQLKSRHWIVTHGDGHVEEIRGEGVVGEEPILRTGEGFEYTSGCVLTTPRGSMHGTYLMLSHDGEEFEVEIPLFTLEAPFSLN